MTLSQADRDAIARAVQRLRSLFEEEFGRQATGRFGLHTERRPSGGSHKVDEAVRPWVEPVEALSLTPTQVAQRAELIGAVAYLRQEGLDGGEVITRLIREASFTATNQLLAVRVAEANGILPEVTAKGRKSSGYREVVHDLFPLLAQQDDEGLWIYIQICGDELGATVPLLFDRRLPTSAFVPSRPCLDSALDIINNPDVVAAWAEPEALGWAYQFFNGDDVEAMRRASPNAPQNSRELAVRNQFFTPRYVVDWLVQNTLGRRLRQAGYELDLPLLVGEAGDRNPLRLEDVRILDPAVGSGHFLLGCYDLLERAWKSKGLSPAEAAPHILRNLHGIEIDPRASQVAQAVLVLRARRAAPYADFQAPAIATARPLPGAPHVRADVFAELSRNARALAEELDDALQQASTLGTLLQVEEHLNAAIDRAARAPMLDEGDVTAEKLEQELIDAAEELARRADATPEARLFAADARDAIRFVELCRQRYDVVLMNPPFGAFIPNDRDYVKAAYPTANQDIYAAFVVRGYQMLNNTGYLGAITNRSGLFLVTFDDWRTQVVLPRLVTLADLGYGVLHNALVEVATYVLSKELQTRTTHVRSLLRRQAKGDLADPKAGAHYEVTASQFTVLPKSVFAYWVDRSITEVFRRLPSLPASGLDARVGLQTSDDFRFLRLWWEVSVDIAEARWVPFAKGGDYAPYYAELYLLVDWEDEGKTVKDFQKSVVRNESYYFQSGLTWSARTASAFSIRPLPKQAIFGHRGNYLGANALSIVLGWANSSAVRYLLELQLAAAETTSSGGAARDYTVGVVQNLPWPGTMPDDIGRATMRIVKILADAAQNFELSPHFLAWQDSRGWAPSHAPEVLEDANSIDEWVNTAYGFSENARSAIYEEVGPPVARYERREHLNETLFVDLYHSSMRALIVNARKHVGNARHISMKGYRFNRRFELLCHIFQAHPRSIQAIIERHGLVAPEEREDNVRRMISYLVGIAFGRWDARKFGEVPHSIEPWNPVPPTPPGMLTGKDGMPARVAPDSYPISLPPDPIMVDDPGDRWDLVRAVQRVAEYLSIERELEVGLRRLGTRDLQTYLRKDFFRDHLDLYSMSRRKAPIYWHLGVPSGKWSAWLYYPELSREALFALLRHAQEKFRMTRLYLDQLESQIRERSASREVRSRYESAHVLTDELREFVAHIDSVAQSGWQPDLNDGAALCAVPLEQLFLEPGWRRELTPLRVALEEGKYPWATVQREFFGSGS